MNTLWQDLRYAIRMLIKNPGFTAVAVLTLALGIGANTAIFSVVNSVLLRPLPFPHSDQLVRVFQTLPPEGITNAGVSYPNFTDWSQQTHAFEQIAASRFSTFAVTGHGEPFYINGEAVTSSLFPLLSVKPLSGRAFSSEDEKADADSVALLSEGLWRDRFGGDPTLVGRTIILDKQPFTVVGILPGSFRYPYQNPPIQAWIPLVQDAASKPLLTRRGGHYLNVVGRLKLGIALAQGQAELETIVNRLAGEYPDANRGWGVRLGSLQEELVGNVRIALLVLLGAVGMILLIACANVANLLLARASSRSREMAVRAAMGASRGRLVRQVLTECVLLSALGGGAGLLLALWGVESLTTFIPADIPRIDAIRVDGWVLGFALLTSILSGLVFGLAPALNFPATNLNDALKEGGRGPGHGERRKKVRGALVIAEVALAVVLLIGAGLLLRSFARVQQVNPGFNPEHVLIAAVSLPQSQYKNPQQWASFYQDVLDRLKAQPGVMGAAAALPLPPNGGGFNFGFEIEGRAPQEPGRQNTAEYSAVSPNYFEVMQIPLLRGRLFTELDAAPSQKVCVITETLARRFFPGQDPIGERLIFGYREQVPRQIVGIVADVKQKGLTEPAPPVMYVPYTQNAWWATWLVVRASGDPAALGPTLRAQVLAVDKNLPLEGLQPLTQAISEMNAQPRFRTLLLALFAATALLLAAVGIYGVISYSVGQRAHEIGIRMALGADRRDVIALVLKEGMALTGVGLCIGLGAAWFVTRALASLLFEVNAKDLTTFGSVAALLAVVALLACYLPARRATKVDPMIALRCD